MTPKQIGAAVRKARGERSIRSIAAQAGLHRDQVTGIEAGTIAYTMPTFLRLCATLGLKVRLDQVNGKTEVDIDPS